MALAAEHLAAVGAGLLECADHVAVGGLVDQRADQCAVDPGIADRQLPVCGHDAFHELVGHRGVHDQSAQRRTPLSCGARRGEHDAAHGEVEVGGRCDDGGVVAAQFEQRLAEPLRHPRPDLLAHPHRTRRADSSATRGSSTSRSPTSRAPWMRRLTSRGAPTSSAARSISAWHANAVNGVSSDGFHTTVSPHTNAIAVFQAHTATGS